MLSLLPDYLVFDLLENWLEVTLLARLDSAYCVRSLRKDFLNQLDTRVVSCASITNAPLINWMMKRNVRTSKIIQNIFEVKPGTGTDSQLQFIQLTTNELRCVELTFVSDSGAILNAIIHNYSKLNVFRCKRISPSDLSELLLRNPNLQILDCSMRRGSADSLRICSLPHLTSLRIIITADDEGDARVVPALIEATRNLQRLSAGDGFDSLPDTAHFKACCGGIKSFNLRTNHNLHASIVNTVKYCPNIVNLDFGHNANMLDSHVLLVAQNLHHLRAISLCGCRDISDESLVHLRTYCAPRLECIRLGANQHITRNGIDTFRRACNPSLKFQYVEIIGEHSFGSLPWVSADVAGITSAQKATHLVLTSCVSVDRILRDSAEQCVSIETITLWIGKYGVCPLSPKGLSELCVKWPRLNTVVLYSMTGGGTAQHVTALAAHAPKITVRLSGELQDFDVMKMPI